MLLRRLGDPDSAAEAARSAARADPARPGPWLALAKYAEHRSKDFELARDYALRFQSLAVARQATPRQLARIAHRLARLERKLARRR